MSAPQHDLPPRQPGHLWWMLVAGVAFAVAASIAIPLTGVQILDIADNARGDITWTTLFAGVFLTGCIVWWLMLGRRRRFTLLRGAIAGVLVAFLAYPVVLALAGIFQRGWAEPPDLDSAQSRSGNVLIRIVLTLLTTGFAATLILA